MSYLDDLKREHKHMLEATKQCQRQLNDCIRLSSMSAKSHSEISILINFVANMEKRTLEIHDEILQEIGDDEQN